MTDLNQAARAAFVSVRGERPRVPEHLADTVPTLEQQEYDADLADFRKMLKALEQEGYRVVPMEQTQEMFEAWIDESPEDDTSDIERLSAALWKAQVAASPEIEI